MTGVEKSLLDRAIGMRIQLARRQNMMLRADLAQALSVDSEVIEEYEKGARSIPDETLADIAQVLHKPVAWFFAELSSEASTGVDTPMSEFEECVSLLVTLRDRNSLDLAKGFLRMAVASTD